MAKFEADALTDLSDLKEVSIRTEKHPDSAVVIWVVVADDEVFVRSFRGAKGRWYRDLAAGGAATLEFAGRPCRPFRRKTLPRSIGPAVSISGSIGRVPMRRRW
jgi:hypothetical protein